MYFLLYFKRDYAASSMKTPRRLDVFASLPTFIVIFQPIHTKPWQIIYRDFPDESLSIDENRMKIGVVVFEFIASRQTDRRGGGLCFIICIDFDIER